jgi:hypothetical protein
MPVCFTYYTCVINVSIHMRKSCFWFYFIFASRLGPLSKNIRTYMPMCFTYYTCVINVSIHIRKSSFWLLLAFRLAPLLKYIHTYMSKCANRVPDCFLLSGSRDCRSTYIHAYALYILYMCNKCLNTYTQIFFLILFIFCFQARATVKVHTYMSKCANVVSDCFLLSGSRDCQSTNRPGARE